MNSQRCKRTRALAFSGAVVIAGTTMFAIGGAACSGSVVATPTAATTGDDGGAQSIDASVLDAAAVDADNGAPSSIFPAFHLQEPTVESYGTAPIVLAAPRIQPIIFEGDAQQAKITSFTHGFSGSNYWKAATSEYGVGDITANDPIIVPASDVSFPSPTTLTDAQIQTFLTTHLDGAHAGWGTADANTIYTVFYGSNVTVTLDSFGQSCQGFGGYHQFITVGAVQIPYAVIPRCTELGPLQGMNDVMTGATSHEIIEASTDPYGTGYNSADLDHLYYDFQPLSEVGDMCAFESDAFYTPPELGFAVQRTWSNKLAALGVSPCAPALGSSIYFAAVPIFKTQVDMVFGAGADNSVPVNGVKVPLGQSASIDLDLISSAAMPAFNVMVDDVPTTQGKASELSFSLDRESGQNGEKLHLTITRIAAASQYGGTEFSILAYTDSTHYHQWMGYASE